MKEKTFYICEVCGNIVEKIHDSGNELTCCMRTMKELVPGETDGKLEFHIPVLDIKDNVAEIRVGEQPHPMEESHYIKWIEIITTKGEMRRCFKPGEKPVVRYNLCDDEKICAVYAYCNIHGLWKCKSCD